MDKNMETEIIGKITSSDNYVIFFDYHCGYSMAALNLLKIKKLKYKGYEISKIPGGLNAILEVLKKNKEKIKFNLEHNTKPILFFNGNFIGGYDELSKKLSD